jgi:hypothetical protein
MMTMTSRRWRWVSARSAGSTLAHCAESAAAHIRPVSGRQAEFRTACLIKAGTLLNLAVLPSSRDARVIASAREEKLCVLDWLADQKIDGASSACTHACIAARLRVIPWKLACAPHAVPLAVQSVWDEFRSLVSGLLN